MIKKLYSVKDSNSKRFYPPMAFTCERDAVDSFTQAVEQENTMYQKFPKDFSLVEIGTFDEIHATLNVCDPRTVVEAADIVQ